MCAFRGINVLYDSRLCGSEFISFYSFFRFFSVLHVVVCSHTRDWSNSSSRVFACNETLLFFDIQLYIHISFGLLFIRYKAMNITDACLFVLLVYSIRSNTYALYNMQYAWILWKIHSNTSSPTVRCCTPFRCIDRTFMKAPSFGYLITIFSLKYSWFGYFKTICLRFLFCAKLMHTLHWFIHTQ